VILISNRRSVRSITSRVFQRVGPL
jgi:hypothetical protein